MVEEISLPVYKDRKKHKTNQYIFFITLIYFYLDGENRVWSTYLSK